MRSPLRHMEEATLRLCLGVIEDVAQALALGGDWTTGDRGERLIEHPRAVRIDGRRRAARLVVHGSRMGLNAPARNAAMRERIAMSGSIDAAAPDDDPGATASVALARWAALLADPIGGGEVWRALRLRTGLADLGAGAVDALDIAWDWLIVRADDAGRHQITVRPTAARRGELVTFEAAAGRSGPGMTPELSSAFDRLLADAANVGDITPSGSGQIPTVVFGRPPEVRVTGELDPLSRLQARRALPEGARLLPRD